MKDERRSAAMLGRKPPDHVSGLAATKAPVGRVNWEGEITIGILVNRSGRRGSCAGRRAELSIRRGHNCRREVRFAVLVADRAGGDGEGERRTVRDPKKNDRERKVSVFRQSNGKSDPQSYARQYPTRNTEGVSSGTKSRPWRHRCSRERTWLKMNQRDRPESHGTGRSMTKLTTIRARLTLKSATYCDRQA